jgi:transcriptional regulator with XRE-family HTH domain
MSTEKIKELREKQGIGQAELARRVGVTPAAILYIEQPGNYPKAAMLPLIADALKVPIDDLFGREAADRRAAGGVGPYRGDGPA